jgi:hypothetical protein
MMKSRATCEREGQSMRLTQTPFPATELFQLRSNYTKDGVWHKYVDGVADLVANWFFANFEDPTRRAPRTASEHVFWGCPLETHDVISIVLEPLATEPALPEKEIDAFMGATLQKIEAHCGDECVPRYGCDPDDVQYDPHFQEG